MQKLAENGGKVPADLRGCFENADFWIPLFERI
jgi:hypothetical protein